MIVVALLAAMQAGTMGLGGGDVAAPAWLDTPTAEVTSEAYPVAADALGLEGRVVLQCAVGDKRRLTGCTVKEESPPALGFAEAALSLAAASSYGGDRGAAPPNSVLVPLRFTMGVDDGEPSADPPVSPVGSRVAKALGLGALFIEVLSRFMEPELVKVPEAVRADLNAAIMDGFNEHRDAIDARLGSALADRYSASDLQQAATFFEGPTGVRVAQVFRATARRADDDGHVEDRVFQEEMAKVMTSADVPVIRAYLTSPAAKILSQFPDVMERAAFDGLFSKLQQSARARFCAQHDCEVRMPAAS